MSHSNCQNNHTPEKPVFITRNPFMKNLYEKVRKAAMCKAPVLITGESGTGKEVLARLLHYHSMRMDKPFYAINCGALPKDIIESELFGHEKGSFTGAVNTKKGCFEQADQGVLFLDEIAEMSTDLQVRLLRVVELKNFRRVGGSKEIETDVQIVSATNRDIDKLIEDGKFREDLYYRLSVIELAVPPLRERKEDIPLLSDYFLSKYTREYNLSSKCLSVNSLNCLMDYNWPGNVRELCNVIERCAIMCHDDLIEPEHLPVSFGETDSCQIDTENDQNSHLDLINIPLGTSMEAAVQMLIDQTLTSVDNNKSKAARILGVSRKTLHNKLTKINEFE